MINQVSLSFIKDDKNHRPHVDLLGYIGWEVEPHKHRTHLVIIQYHILYDMLTIHSTTHYIRTHHIAPKTLNNLYVQWLSYIYYCAFIESSDIHYHVNCLRFLSMHLTIDYKLIFCLNYLLFTDSTIFFLNFRSNFWFLNKSTFNFLSHIIQIN